MPGGGNWIGKHKETVATHSLSHADCTCHLHSCTSFIVQFHFKFSVLQLPTEYFTTVLGKWRKYSACYYLGDNDNIDTAEENMLRAPPSSLCPAVHQLVLHELGLSNRTYSMRLARAHCISVVLVHAEMYCDKMKLSSGMSVLELGCGWGSFTLFAVRPCTSLYSCTYVLLRVHTALHALYNISRYPARPSTNHLQHRSFSSRYIAYSALPVTTGCIFELMQIVCRPAVHTWSCFTNQRRRVTRWHCFSRAVVVQAAKYPACSFRAVSNSATQRVYILEQAAARGLSNITAATADMNSFVAESQYDRVLSVEMFEHMKNYGVCILFLLWLLLIAFFCDCGLLLFAL